MASVDSDPMPARHVFKFAVSGIDLSEKQQQHVAQQVALAGVAALASFEFRNHDQVLFDLPEWLGLWLHLMDQRLVDQEGVQLPGNVIAAQRRSLSE
jgi:hypothetical protein